MAYNGWYTIKQNKSTINQTIRLQIISTKKKKKDLALNNQQ